MSYDRLLQGYTCYTSNKEAPKTIQSVLEFEASACDNLKRPNDAARLRRTIDKINSLPVADYLFSVEDLIIYRISTDPVPLFGFQSSTKDIVTLYQTDTYVSCTTLTNMEDSNDMLHFDVPLSVGDWTIINSWCGLEGVCISTKAYVMPGIAYSTNKRKFIFTKCRHCGGYNILKGVYS